MVARTKVLWIEDSARYELSELTGPVYASRKYVLNLAEDATTATYHLLNSQFDVLIVDMRIPPGDNPVWQKIYQKGGKDKDTAQLGLKLLRWLLDGKNGELDSLGKPPDWVSAKSVAVFTVEGQDQIRSTLDELEVTNYVQKRATRRDTALLDLIESVMVDKYAKI
jgi:hypothetical protein